MKGVFGWLGNRVTFMNTTNRFCTALDSVLLTNEFQSNKLLNLEQTIKCQLLRFYPTRENVGWWLLCAERTHPSQPLDVTEGSPTKTTWPASPLPPPNGGWGGGLAASSSRHWLGVAMDVGLFLLPIILLLPLPVWPAQVNDSSLGLSMQGSGAYLCCF